MSRPNSRAFAGLFALTAINLLNFADRYVVGGVQELIKHDTTFQGGMRDAAGHLTDTSLGALTTAFIVVYMLASPITGMLGDRVPRKFLIAGGVFIWSLATIASGLAESYSTLLVARAFIGIGEAGYATVAPSLISDLFQKDWRGKALGIFYSVMPLGAAAGFGIGATVGVHYGWRHAFFVAGIPGIALALFSLFLSEPVRGCNDAPSERGPALSVKESWLALARNPVYLCNTIGQTLMTFAVGGLANWMPSFMSRNVGIPPDKAGQYFGALTALAGISGTLIGTWLGEVYAPKRRHGYFFISGLGLVIAVPCILTMAAGLGQAVTLTATFCALFFILLNTAPLGTSLVNSVPATMRATATSANILAIHLLGDAISPPIIGAISDGTGSLAVAVGANAIPVLLGGLVLLWGARSLKDPSQLDDGAPARAA